MLVNLYVQMVDNTPTVLITGGQGDLARALTGKFTAAGWNVLAPGRTQLDVADASSVDHYFATMNRLDVLINNAGIIIDKLLPQMNADDWDEVVNVSLRGSFLCSRAAARLMTPARSGHILFISSRSARTGPRGQSNYAAAKAGLVALCQSLARELGPDNIRSNVIFPGYMETKMNRHLPPAAVERHRADNALGRFNTVDNAARFLFFLATLDHVSGQVFTLDSRIDRWT
jgi:3-oxoacyl-[acyl-carrier protein] reductase